MGKAGVGVDGGMVLRKMTDSEKALWLAIEANRKTIRQLQLTNKHLQDLLPIMPQLHQGAVLDPRTGDGAGYQKKKNRGTKP